MTSLCLLLSFGRDPLCSMHFSLFILSRSLFSVVSRPSLPILTQLLSTRTPPLPPLRRYEQSFTPPSSPPRPHPLLTPPHLTLFFAWQRGTAVCSIRSSGHSPSLAVLSAVALCIAYLSPPSPRSHCPLLYSYPHHVSISRSPYSVFVASVSIFVSYALSRCPALLLLSSSLRDFHLHFGLSRRPLAPTACLSV